MNNCYNFYLIEWNDNKQDESVCIWIELIVHKKNILKSFQVMKTCVNEEEYRLWCSSRFICVKSKEVWQFSFSSDLNLFIELSSNAELRWICLSKKRFSFCFIELIPMKLRSQFVIDTNYQSEDFVDEQSRWILSEIWLGNRSWVRFDHW